MEQTKYFLTLTDFHHLELSGVHEVVAFDENLIELSLGDTSLFLAGHDLKIESFSADEGTICVSGEIDSVIRELQKAQTARSFLSRLFS